MATFPNCKTKLFFYCNGLFQLNIDSCIITGHDHFHDLIKRHNACNIQLAYHIVSKETNVLGTAICRDIKNMRHCIEHGTVTCNNSENNPVHPGCTRNHIKLFFSHLPKFPLTLCGAHDQSRTDEPLPYQGSALPTELHGLG
jgi:hypothetical protein